MIRVIDGEPLPEPQASHGVDLDTQDSIASFAPMATFFGAIFLSGVLRTLVRAAAGLAGHRRCDRNSDLGRLRDRLTIALLARTSPASWPSSPTSFRPRRYDRAGPAVERLLVWRLEQRLVVQRQRQFQRRRRQFWWWRRLG